jgi:hypothetical protein
MASGRTIGDEQAGKLVERWHALMNNLRLLPVAQRVEVLLTIAQDVTNLKDDIGELSRLPGHGVG